MVRDLHPVGHYGDLHLIGPLHPPPQRGHQRNQRVHGGHRGIKLHYCGDGAARSLILLAVL
jgi:hypothetical protein